MHQPKKSEDIVDEFIFRAGVYNPLVNLAYKMQKIEVEKRIRYKSI
jgi:hypothetical protein